MTSLEGKSYPALSNIPRKQELNGGREITLSFLRGDINDVFLSEIETGWTVNFKGDIYHLQNEREDRHGNKQFDGVLDFFHHFNGRWHVDEVDDKSMQIESSIRPLFQGSYYNLQIIDTFHANVMNYSRPQNSTQRFLYFTGRHRAEFNIPIGTQTVQMRNKIGVKRNDIILHEDDNLVDFNISTETGSFCTAIKGYYRFRPVDEDSHETVPTREYDYISPMAAKYGVIWGEPIWDERFDTLTGIRTACQEKQESTWVSSFEIDAEAFEVPLGIGDELRFVVPSKEINGYIRVVEINEEFDEEGHLIRATYTFGNENIANGYRSLQYDAIDNLNDLLLGKSKLPMNVLPGAVRDSTAVINAGVASSFEYRRNGIYGYNTDNPLGVTRYNANGIGFSTDGGQTFENALTYLGLTASAITTGTMLANRIAGGMLTSLNSNTEFDLNTGDLRMARSHFYLGNRNDTRVLDMKDGEIESIYNGELSMKFGGFRLEFYNQRNDMIGFLGPTYSIDGLRRPGLALVIEEEILNIGYEIDNIYRPTFRSDMADESDGRPTTTVNGPFNDASDGSRLYMYANRRIVSSDTSFDNDYTASDQPALLLDQGRSTNNATLYFGGVNRRRGAEFAVRFNTGLDSWASRIIAGATTVTLGASADSSGATGNRFTDYRTTQYQGNNGVAFSLMDGSTTAGQVFLGYNIAALIGSDTSSSIWVGGTGSDRYVRSMTVRGNTTTLDQDHVQVSTSGTLRRITSSRRNKLNEKEIGLEYSKRLLDIKPKTWHDKTAVEQYAEFLTTGKASADQGADSIRPVPGIIAEDVHAAGLTDFVAYDKEGRPDSINHNLPYLMLPLIQDHEERIQKLEEMCL